MSEVPAYVLAKNASKTGYLTKQGSQFKTWKKRWFILQSPNIYYFSDPKDTNAKGVIILNAQSSCTETSLTQKKFAFQIQTVHRTFLVTATNLEDKRSWMQAINEAIRNMRPQIPSYESITNLKPLNTMIESMTQNTTSNSARTLLKTARDSIIFLQEGKPERFWQIWLQSIPSIEDLGDSRIPVEFYIFTTADLEQLSWRVCGPQKAFIQLMVDFFFSVGAPESEIEKLNDMGFNVRPFKIGSWVEMSEQGGMDGGWFFPVETTLEVAMRAAEPGVPVQKVNEWAAKHAISKVYTIGRDMGATPPRQTEIKVILPGDDADTRLAIAVDAFDFFGFPQIPEEAMKAFKGSPSTEMGLSIIMTSGGFVRLGILTPNPAVPLIDTLVRMSDGNQEKLKEFEQSIGNKKPAYVEYHYLMSPFGYGVYKEGFNAVFHYHIGDEWSAKAQANLNSTNPDNV